MSKNSKNLRMIVRLAVVAALYVALTLALYPLSFGAVQFRLSEALMMLVAYNPLYSISLIAGCLISNLSSPMGVVDIVFGTLATALSCLPMLKIKNKYVSSLMPSIVNAIVIGLELTFAYQMNFAIAASQVFLGEFVVVSLIGVPLFKSIEKNKPVSEMLNLTNMSKPSKLDDLLSVRVLFTLAFSVIGIVLYFKLGLYNILIDESYDVYSLSRFTFNIINNHYNRYFIFLLVAPIITFLSSVLLKKKPSAIFNIIIDLISIIVLIVGLINVIPSFDGPKVDVRFYFYFVFEIVLIIYEIYQLIYKEKTEDINQLETDKEE